MKRPKFGRGKPNENHIIRVRNVIVKDLLETVALETGATYQMVSEELFDMMTDGYTIGKDTPIVLTHRVTLRLNENEG